MKLWVMLLSSLQLVKSQFFFISWDLCIVWKFTLCSRLSEYWLMSEVCLNCRVSSLARGISKKNGTEDNLKKKYLRAELRRRKAALSSMANSLTGKNEDTQGVIFLVNFTCWNSFKFFPLFSFLTKKFVLQLFFENLSKMLNDPFWWEISPLCIALCLASKGVRWVRSTRCQLQSVISRVKWIFRLTTLFSSPFLADKALRIPWKNLAGRQSILKEKWQRCILNNFSRVSVTS